MPRHDKHDVAVMVYQAATEMFPVEERARYAAEGGSERLLDELVVLKGREVSRRVDEGFDYGEAFRRETNDWSRPLSVELAKYLLRETSVIPDDDGHNFEGFVESFESYFVSPHEESVSVDVPENTHGSHTDVLIAGRFAGFEITEDDADRILDHQSFIENVTQYDDLETAINAFQYDSVLSPTIHSELAAPEEWPDGMDAGMVESYTCESCRNRYHGIYTVDNERALATGNEILDIHHIEDDDSLYALNNDYDKVCQMCYQHLSSEGNEVALIHEDTNVIFKYRNSLIKVERGTTDDLANISDEIIQRIINGTGNVVRMDEENCDVYLSDVVNAIADNDPVLCDNGWVAIIIMSSFSGTNRYLSMDPTNEASVKAAKGLQDGHMEAINV